jgi:hypothetical protein
LVYSSQGFDLDQTLAAARAFSRDDSATIGRDHGEAGKLLRRIIGS